MSVRDNAKNRGAHGDSSFMLGRVRPSSENPPALAVGSVKILALDQASHITGYAYFEGTELCEHGVIDLSDEKDAWERTQLMRLRIDRLIDKRKPEIVLLEEVTFQRNPKTLIELGRLQGMVMSSAFSRNIPVTIYYPSEWRGRLNFAQGRGHLRGALKKQAMDLVAGAYGISVTEDEADAISIGLAHLVSLGLADAPEPAESNG